MLYTEVFCMRYYAGFSQIGSHFINVSCFIGHCILNITMAMSQKQYIGVPESFNAKTDDWILYCQCFEHFLLANGITDDGPKNICF